MPLFCTPPGTTDGGQMKLRLVGNSDSDGGKIDNRDRRIQLSKIRKEIFWCDAFRPLDLGPRIWLAFGCAIVSLGILSIIGLHAVYTLSAAFVGFLLVTWRSSLPLTFTEILDSALADYEPLNVRAFLELQHTTQIKGGRLCPRQVADWHAVELAALDLADGVKRKNGTSRFLDKEL